MSHRSLVWIRGSLILICIRRLHQPFRIEESQRPRIRAIRKSRRKETLRPGRMEEITDLVDVQCQFPVRVSALGFNGPDRLATYQPSGVSHAAHAPLQTTAKVLLTSHEIARTNLDRMSSIWLRVSKCVSMLTSCPNRTKPNRAMCAQENLADWNLIDL